MQLQSILFSFLLVTSAAAKGNKAVSEKSQCKQIRKLQKFVDLASNTTRLQEVTNNNATKVAQLQTEASAAATQLTTLQSNATLVSDCAIINASEDQEDRCEETFELQAFITFASNTTALAAKTDNNATKIAAIQAKASTAATTPGPAEPPAIDSVMRTRATCGKVSPSGVMGTQTSAGWTAHRIFRSGKRTSPSTFGMYINT